MVFRRLQSLWNRRWLSEDEYRSELAAMNARRPTPLFWMLGKTGSGKTSLVRYLTGAADAEIGSGFRPQTTTSRRYDFPASETPLLRFLDTRGLGEAGYDPAEDLARFDADAHLLVVTVRLMDHALSELVESLRKIRAVRPSRPALLVLTCVHEAYPGEQHPDPDPVDSGRWPEHAPETIRRSYDRQRERFETLVDRVALVDLTRADDGFHNPALGGGQLTQSLIELLPAALRDTLVSWSEARGAFRDLLARRAEPYILGYSVAAASAAAVPIPWVDLPVVFAIQAHLVSKLAQLHDQPTTKDLLQALGPLSARVLTRFAVRELLKAVPVVGQAANAALAFSYTYGMGKACLWYLQRSRAGHVPSTDSLKEIWQSEIDSAARLWRERKTAGTAAVPPALNPPPAKSPPPADDASGA
jgi:uncharacterized protein (DUF697 family)/predicted GTPase